MGRKAITEISTFEIVDVEEILLELVPDRIQELGNKIKERFPKWKKEKLELVFYLLSVSAKAEVRPSFLAEVFCKVIRYDDNNVDFVKSKDQETIEKEYPEEYELLSEFFQTNGVINTKKWD